MKKTGVFLSLFLCCILLAGCAKGDRAREKVTEYTDIVAESKAILQRERGMGGAVGVQFYQGDIVQICPSSNAGIVDIYLCREGGGSELLLEGMPEDYYFGQYFLDSEGNLYRWRRSATGGSIDKLDASGKTLYSIPTKDIGEQRVEDICQLSDGRIFITYLEGGMGDHYTLSEIDSAAGAVSKVSTVKLDGMGRVAAGEEGLLYMDERGVYEIDMKDGSKTSVLSFIGTSYLTHDVDDIRDFRVREDGSVEILRYDRENGSSEVLRSDTVITNKGVLTLRCYNFSKYASSTWSTEGWLKNQIELFNKQSDDYLILLDESLEGMAREDFSKQTSIEMTAGKGPDILFGDVLGEYVYGAIQKKALVDLAPYMEKSGIKEEDYFPAAFGCWKEKDGIYGICMEVSLTGYRMDREVLGGLENPDVETLVDALLAWQGDGVFMGGHGSEGVLLYLLQGSEDIWGMVDWNRGTCDFSGELCSKILETAKRYGDDGGKDSVELAEGRVMSVMGFDTAADREAEGKVSIGVPFDDGGHGVIMSSISGYKNEMLAVNANSGHIEGAWEFINFLLKEEAQMSFEREDIDGNYDSNTRIPVNKKAFDVCTKRRVDKLVKRKEKTFAWYSYDNSTGEFTGMYPRSYEDLTEEKLTEFKEFIEDARPLPIRTVPILDIICEEAKYYFDGTKSVEEVTAMIQNRVQLYMDENN